MRASSTLVAALLLASSILTTGRGSAANALAPLDAKVVAPGFVAAVGALRKRTQLPIVLPAKLEPDTYVSFENASAARYTLYVDLAQDCKGLHACGFYALAATRATPADGRVHAKRIDLGRGVDGDITASEVRAYPTDTTIAWRMGTTAFVLSVNSHGPDAKTLARSIVANLRIVPSPSRL